MIEIAEKQKEWMKTERAISLTNEQILGLKGYLHLSQRDWIEARQNILDLANMRKDDGSLKYPGASQAVADMDEMEYQAKAALMRMEAEQ